MMTDDTPVSAKEAFAARPVVYELSNALRIDGHVRLGYARTLADVVWSHPKTAIQYYLDLWNWDPCLS